MVHKRRKNESSNIHRMLTFSAVKVLIKAAAKLLKLSN